MWNIWWSSLSPSCLAHEQVTQWHSLVKWPITAEQSWSKLFSFMVQYTRPLLTANLSGRELLDVNSVATNEKAIVVH